MSEEALLWWLLGYTIIVCLVGLYFADRGRIR